MEYNTRYTDFIGKMTAVKSLKANAELRSQNLFSKLSDIENDIKTHEESVALCDKCIEDQIKLKNYFEQSTSEFLNTVMTGMVEPTDEPTPRIKFILEPVEDEMGVITALKPLAQEEGKEPETLNEFGAAVRNLVGLATRTTAVAVTPGLRPLIVGDEVALNLHTSLWDSVFAYYEDLHRNIPDFQMILVSNVVSKFPTTHRVVKKGDTSYVYSDSENEYVGETNATN